MEQKSFKVSKVVTDNLIEKKPGFKKNDDKIKISLRWPNWVRDRVYKHIATQILTGKIGITRAQSLSPQQLVVLACADKLNLKIVEEAEKPTSDSEIVIFLQLIPKEVYVHIEEEVERLKRFDPKVSINKWVLQAVQEYLDK